jgi:hypothetical protein
MTTVTIQTVNAADELHRWYDGQTSAQPAYIELGLRDGVLLASYDAEIGNGVPPEVFHGIDRRWLIPVLDADAANKLLHEVAPLAQRVVDGAKIVWDGNNHVGRLTTGDARDADDEITALCERITEDGEHADGLLQVWSMDSIGTAWDADEAGITAATTDAELAAIEKKLLAEFRDGMDQPTAVIHGLDQHLKELRDELVREAADDF